MSSEHFLSTTSLHDNWQARRRQRKRRRELDEDIDLAVLVLLTHYVQRKRRPSRESLAALEEITQVIEQRTASRKAELAQEREEMKMQALACGERLVQQTRNSIRAIESSPSQTEMDLFELNRLKRQLPKYQALVASIANEA